MQGRRSSPLEITRPFTRRELLARSGMGLGALGLGGLLADQGLIGTAKGDGYTNPMQPRQPHFPAKAKHVIHLFLNGGPSHVDTFDPKPSLQKYAGQNLPMENLRTERKTGVAFPRSMAPTKQWPQSRIMPL